MPCPNMPGKCPSGLSLRLLLSLSAMVAASVMATGMAEGVLGQVRHGIIELIALLYIFGLASLGLVLRSWRARRLELERREAELKASAERYRSLADNTFDLLAEYDSDGCYTYVSPSFRRILGYRPDELLGTWSFAIVHPDDRAAMSQLYEAVLTSGSASWSKVRLRARSGEWRWTEGSGQIYEDASGAKRFVTVSRDVTEKVEAEEALGESESRIRALLNAVPDLIVHFDREGRYLDIHASTFEPYLPVDEILGKHVTDVLPSNVAEAVMAGIERAFATGEIQLLEYRLKIDGVERYRESRVVPTESGEVYLITSDVTDSMRARAERIHLREQMEDAQRIAQIGSWELDLDDGSLRASPEMCRIYGLDPAESELTAAVVEDCVHPDDRDRVRAAWEQASAASAEGGDKTTIEWRIRRDDGSIRHLQAVAGFVRDADGVSHRVVATIRDVTEQHEADAERRELEAQLRRTQRMEAVGRLAAGVSHDFKSLLTIIQVNLESAQAMVMPTGRDAIDQALKATRSASDLSRQLVTIGRSGSGPREPMFVAPVVRDVIGLLRRTFADNVDIDTDVGNEVRIVGDQGQISQALLNLALNARDAMAEGGMLTVRARRVFSVPDAVTVAPREDGYVLLEVTDSGEGMDAETQEHMFEPFFTTKGEAGSGLGASIVYGIVHDHGGMVTVESEPGSGTCIRLYLPAAQAEVTTGLVAGADGEAAGRATALPDVPTVLVVDDLKPLRLVSGAILEAAGYRVLSAESGEAALEILQSEAVDVVVLDCVMPGLSGRQVYDKLGDLPRMPKVLFVSGFTADAMADLQQNDDWAFLAKPFGAGELRAATNALIGREDVAATAFSKAS